MVGGEWADALLDEEQLVDLVLAGEHGQAVDELAEDAADRPDIHLFAVFGTHEEFRGAVPASGDVVCQWVVGP